MISFRKWASSTFDHLIKIGKSDEGNEAGVDITSGYNFFPKYMVSAKRLKICNSVA